MSKFYTREDEVKQANGKITQCEITVHENDEKKPELLVVRHNENLNEAEKSEFTEKLALKLSSPKEYNIPPENLNWYEQRADGKYDQVTFKFLDRDVETRGENLSEYSRTPVQAETVERLENKAKHEAMMSEWKTLEAPAEGQALREQHMQQNATQQQQEEQTRG
jgi:hypothetical protein